MSGEEVLLRVENLRTYFHTGEGVVRAADGVSFELRAGETLGLVGESGCGKTVTGLSIMRLVDPPGRVEPGSRILMRGNDLTELSEERMRRIRGNEISMIFQEPMTSLNPVWPVGDQIVEAVRLHRRASKREARERVVEMLALVGIPNPESRAKSYPHELSGGLRQRAMIAMALACEPDLLIADEPTTALDVTIQAEIIDLLGDLQARLGMGMIFVSHDLGVVAQIADQIAVMYAGQIVERASATELFQSPKHPYSEGLLRAVPRIDHRSPRLAVIPGKVPAARNWPQGCRFHPRCPYAWGRCHQEPPPLLGARRLSRCWLEEEPEHRAGGWPTTPTGVA